MLFLVENCLFSISVLLLDQEMARMWAGQLVRLSRLLTGPLSEDTRAWQMTEANITNIFMDRDSLRESVKEWTLDIS